MQHVYLKVCFWKISVWFLNGIFQIMGEKVARKEMRHAGKMDKYRKDIMMKSSMGLHQNEESQRTFIISPLQLFFITVSQHLISCMTDKASSVVTDMELNHGQGQLSGVGKQMAVLYPILFVIHHLKCTCTLIFYTIQAFFNTSIGKFKFHNRKIATKSWAQLYIKNSKQLFKNKFSHTTVIRSLSNHCSLSSVRGHISGLRADFIRLTQRRDSNSPGEPATLVASLT